MKSIYDSLFTEPYRELNFIDCALYATMLDLTAFSVANTSETSFYKNASDHHNTELSTEIQWVHFADHPFSTEQIKIPSSFALVNQFMLRYPKLCKMLIENINDGLHTDLTLETSHVSLARTTRSVPRHKDVARRGAINCFLQNGDAAKTCFYTDMSSTIPYHTVHTQTNKSYIIDSELPHDVIQKDDNTERFFLTMNIPYC